MTTKLTQKRKTEIAHEIMDNSEFQFENHRLRHLRKVVREMLIEAMDKALTEAEVAPPATGAG
jgi:hypothetical protein